MLFIDQTKWHHGWRTSWTLSKRSSLQCDTCRGLARWSFIGSLNKYLILRPLTKIFRGDLLSAPCTIALHRDPAQQLLPESQHETARGFSTTAAALKKRSCCCLLTLTTPLFPLCEYLFLLLQFFFISFLRAVRVPCPANLTETKTRRKKNLSQLLPLSQRGIRHHPVQIILCIRLPLSHSLASSPWHCALNFFELFLSFSWLWLKTSASSMPSSLPDTFELARCYWGSPFHLSEPANCFPVCIPNDLIYRDCTLAAAQKLRSHVSGQICLDSGATLKSKHTTPIEIQPATCFGLTRKKRLWPHSNTSERQAKP